MIDYSILDSDKLMNLLFTEEDRLPRQAVDEFIRRGERIIEPLSKIVLEESNWAKERPEFWTPIHAVFILEERRFREKEPFPIVAFDEEDVERIFSTNSKHIALYTRDWLSFYDEEHIKRRQERWKTEAEKKVERQYEDESEELLEPPAQETPKIGRNSPCPCGSGKKYKKCCMGKDKKN